jgi:hypothetical protein
VLLFTAGEDSKVADNSHFKRGHRRTLDHIAVAIVAVSANLRRSQETCYLARMESNGQRDHLHLFSSFVA